MNSILWVKVSIFPHVGSGCDEHTQRALSGRLAVAVRAAKLSMLALGCQVSGGEAGGRAVGAGAPAGAPARRILTRRILTRGFVGHTVGGSCCCCCCCCSG